MPRGINKSDLHAKIHVNWPKNKATRPISHAPEPPKLTHFWITEANEEVGVWWRKWMVFEIWSLASLMTIIAMPWIHSDIGLRGPTVNFWTFFLFSFWIKDVLSYLYPSKKVYGVAWLPPPDPSPINPLPPKIKNNSYEYLILDRCRPKSQRWYIGCPCPRT